MPETIEHINVTVPSYAMTALSVLEDAGFESWLVGGYVRDAVRGDTAHDVDIATQAPAQRTLELFSAAGFHAIPTGIEHGTITVVIESNPIEITTFRTEGSYSDARHPDEVRFVQSIEEDLARRDFTINAIAYHPDRGICDPFGGVDDISRKIIRTVGDPERRFSEDALRIMRAVRFRSILGFTVEDATAAALLNSAANLANVSVERFTHELDRFLRGSHVHDALMEYVDVIAVVVPELNAMKGFEQHTRFHVYDVLEHTAYVIQNTPPYQLIRWAALFHDMGKPDSFTQDPDGTGHFRGHPKESVRHVNEVGARLKLPRKLLADLRVIVKYHDTTIEPTPKSVKRWLRRLDGRIELFHALTDIKRGDALSQAPFCHKRTELADELDALLDQVLAEDAVFTIAQLNVSGNDLIAQGLRPGRDIGRLLDTALEAVIDEAVPNEHDALVRYLTEIARVEGLLGEPHTD